jgi:two-component system cell cycle response regulator
VSTLRQTLRELLSTMRDRPDEIVLDIGAGGELLVARIRLVATVLLMLMPLINLLTGGGVFESLAGFAGTGLGLLLAFLWLTLAKQRRRFPWLPFVTSASDVSMETLVLLLLATQSPAASLNTLIVWSCYPLSIFATALRNDGRVTLFAGLLAIIQYSALVIWVFVQAGPHGVLATAAYGEVSVSNQAQRLVLLLVATLLTAVVVYRIQRLVMLSGTDTLTGLPNRSFLVHRVPQIIEQSRKQECSITLAIIDLDHFKRINDDYGHPVGDRALRHVVEVLRNELSREEPLMRIGGEEFVLLLQHPIGTAWERIEALRRRVASTPFTLDEDDVHATSNTCTLTFSAGLASCPQDEVDVSGLMRHADQRLRKAKQTGRNRVVARE